MSTSPTPSEPGSAPDGRRRAPAAALGRRHFLVGTGAATAAAALAVDRPASAATGGTVPADTPADTATEAVTIQSVGPGGRLLVRRADGRTAEVVDTRGRDRWHPGDEAVVERRLVGGRWTVASVTRLYRPILDERVSGRQGNELVMESGPPVTLTGETAYRSDSGGFGSPTGGIRAGDVIAGISYLDAATDTRIAVQIGVRPRPGPAR